MGSVELEVVSEGPVHCYAGLGNVLVSIYWGAPDAAVLEDRIPWVERVRERHGRGGLLVVVCDGATGSLPDASFRERSRAQAQRFEDTIVFSASVIEGDGVLPGLIRAFLRGLALLAPRRVETAFFDRSGPATDWVAARAVPHGGPDASLLRNALETLRARRLG